MAANLKELLEKIDGDLRSPSVIDDFDRVLAKVLQMRNAAAVFHGAALVELTEVCAPSESITAAPKREAPGSAQGRLAYDGTVRGLIAAYQADPDSSFHKLRFRTKQHYTQLLRRIETDYGSEVIADLAPRDLRRWHEAWLVSGVAIAHARIRMVRGLFTFGQTDLNDEHCARISAALGSMRFAMSAERDTRITTEQVIAIRNEAYRQRLSSMALAQAIQFECRLRQKDVIGEWVPRDQEGESETFYDDKKWIRGLQWSQIDDGFVLHHVTSKRGKTVKSPLRMAPMVIEEFRRIYNVDIGAPCPRDMLPLEGPMIVCEATERPWNDENFRRTWRRIARKVGVPDEVRNADSRTGTVGKAADVGIDDDDDAVARAMTKEVSPLQRLSH